MIKKIIKKDTLTKIDITFAYEKIDPNLIQSQILKNVIKTVYSISDNDILLTNFANKITIVIPVKISAILYPLF